jgi:hypothetical protein
MCTDIPDVTKIMHPVFQNISTPETEMMGYSLFFCAAFEVLKQQRQQADTAYFQTHPARWFFGLGVFGFIMIDEGFIAPVDFFLERSQMFDELTMIFVKPLI